MANLKPIEKLLGESGVTELMWNRFDQCFVEMRGTLHSIPSPFRDAGEFHALVNTLAKLDNTVGTGSLQFDGMLPDGSRYHATLPPLSPFGPTLTIRKFSRNMRSLDDLVGSQFLTPKLGRFFEACVKGRANIVISGATGAGKTTLLNSLISLVDTTERVITIEDVPEIQAQHANWVRLLAVRDQNAVNVRDCLIGCLRMRPDRIIVGECRSSETLEMLQALNTGHDGGMTTLHANSPADALTRLESLILFHSEAEISVRALRRQIVDAVDLIVQVKKGLAGQRYVDDVMELVSMEGDVITRSSIFKRPDNRKETGKTISTGHPPTFLSKLEARGISLPKGFFDPQSFET